MRKFIFSSYRSYRRRVALFAICALTGAISSFSFFAHAQSPVPLFFPPEAPAPDDGRLNDIQDLDDYLRMQRTTLQSLQGPLDIANDFDTSAHLGVAATNGALYGSAGAQPPNQTNPAAVYGYSIGSQASLGILGYANGAGSVGVVGRAGLSGGIAGQFYGRVQLLGEGGGQLAGGQGIWNNSGAIISTPAARFNALDIQGDYMYVAGYSDVVAGANGWRIEKRRLSDGALCTASAACDGGEFGAGGAMQEANGHDNNSAEDIAVDGEFIYVVGWDSWDKAGEFSPGVPYATFRRWRIEKRNASNGALVTAFDVDGFVQVRTCSLFIDDHGCADDTSCTSSGWGICVASDPFVPTRGVITARSAARAIKIDSTSMYVAGEGNQGWRIEKRSKDTGDYVTAFNGGGSVSGVVTDVAGDELYDIAIDGTYLYAVGKNDSGQWMIQKRRLDNGRLCTAANCSGVAFDTDGIVTVPGGGAHTVVVDSANNYLYVGGYVGTEWRIEKRLATTGALVTSPVAFDTDGIIQTGRGTTTAAVMDGTYLYAVGDDAIRGWRTEKRLLTTGALDASFGTYGIARSGGQTLVGNNNTPYDVYAQYPYLYIVGNGAGVDGMIERRYMGNNSGDFYVQDRATAGALEAYMPSDAQAAVYAAHGLQISGIVPKAAVSDVDYGYGLYGESLAARGMVLANNVNYASLSAPCVDNGASQCVYGLSFIANQNVGSYFTSSNGNGVRASVALQSQQPSAEGRAAGAGGYGLYSYGDMYAAYLQGDVVIDAGGAWQLGDIQITETGMQELLTWCESAGDDCDL